MVERVMILDAVLSDRRCWWLSTADDKWRFFCVKRDNYLRPEDYPHIAFGSGRERTVRCFPDKLPIGIEKDSTHHLVFFYLVNRRIPVDFRQFLIRHLTLLRFVRTWTVRLLVPRQVHRVAALHQMFFAVDPDGKRALQHVDEVDTRMVVPPQLFLRDRKELRVPGVEAPLRRRVIERLEPIRDLPCAKPIRQLHALVRPHHRDERPVRAVKRNSALPALVVALRDSDKDCRHGPPRPSETWDRAQPLRWGR
jgi:hypothetical protein